MSIKTALKNCRIIFSTGAVLCAFLLSACTPTHATRGNFLANDQIAEIEIGRDTQNDIIGKWGSPTSKSIFNESNIWYYVGVKTEKTSFFDPKITDKKVVLLAFDDTGTVSDIAAIDREGYEIPIENRKTPTSGHELTILQQLLGNVGRFRPQDVQ